MDEAPETTFETGEAYTGSQGASDGIIGMMEVIKSDFVRTIKETEKAEAKAEEKTEAKPSEEAKTDAVPKTDDAPKIAVAVKPAADSGEPEAKRLKPTPPDPNAVRKQIEYYLSDDNLKYDKFFHEKISGDAQGWLEVSLVLSCNKMKAMRATKEDVLAALKGSQIEVKEDSLYIRRPGNMALPTLESRPQHQKKSVGHSHDGGVIAVFNAIPAEQKIHSRCGGRETNTSATSVFPLSPLEAPAVLKLRDA